MKNEAILIDGELFDSISGELINEVEQVEVEVIEDTLPNIVLSGGTHIKTNTEQLKKELVSYLKKYDVEVTEDNEKDCSKLATELNSLSKDLDTKRKSVASEIKKPADDLKSAVDELISIIQEKRTKILNDVEIYKSKRMDFLRTLLNAKLVELYDTYKVSEKYQVCNIEPLVLEGSLAKSQLSKKALESLDLMVAKVKRIEDSVIIREMQLELKCSDAGLITPIELKEVEHIIELPDYDDLLQEMIEKRIEIQEQVKKQLEEQEVKRQEILKQEEIKKQNEALELEEKAKQEIIEKQKETGKKKIVLVATFEVEVNSDIEDNKVWSKYVVELQKNFKSFVNLEIKK
jgi:hypothetical protein